MNLADTAPGEDAVMLDVETTGTSIDDDAIISIGLVRITDRNVVERFASLVRPPRHALESMSEESVAVHGIDAARLRTERPFAAVWNGGLRQWIERHGLDVPVVAHNATFDQGFIARAIEHCEAPDHPWTDSERWIDTWSLSRRAFGHLGGRHGLDALAQRLGLRARGRSAQHDALGDATLLAQCWLAWGAPTTGDLFEDRPALEENLPLPAVRAARLDADVESEWRAWWNDLFNRTPA